MATDYFSKGPIPPGFPAEGRVVVLNTGCGWVDARSWNNSYCDSYTAHLEKKIFLDHTEVSKLLNVMPSVILSALENKELFGQKLDGQWRIHRKAVDLWIGNVN